MIWLPRTTAQVLALGSLVLGACGDDSTSDSSETGANDSTGATAAVTSEASTAVTAAVTSTASTAATAMAEDTACTDDLPQLHIVNATGNGVEEITMLACDMTDQSSFPVPPGGLPDGGELTIDLPGPGCWVLQYSGEGCFGDTPGSYQLMGSPMIPSSAVSETRAHSAVLRDVS